MPVPGAAAALAAIAGIVSPASPVPSPTSAATPTAIATPATAAAASTLLVDVRPRLLALLGHCVEGLVDALGLDPALAGAGSVRQHLVLRLHARAGDKVSLVAIDVGDVARLGDGALVARVVDVIAAGEVVEEVGEFFSCVAEGDAAVVLLLAAGVHVRLLRRLLWKVPLRLAV